MISELNSEEHNDTKEKIKEIQSARKIIQEEMEKLQKILDQSKLEEHLLNLKLVGPIIVTADESINKYKFISEPVTLEHLGIVLHPLWLKLECTYPKWSKDFMSVNIIQYDSSLEGKGCECLIDGLHDSLNWSYQKCRDIICDHELSVPITFIYNYTLDSNIKIDFSTGEKIKGNEFKRYQYYLSCSDDENMLFNSVKIKYILLLPLNYSSQIVIFDTDIMEYL